MKRTLVILILVSLLTPLSSASSPQTLDQLKAREAAYQKAVKERKPVETLKKLALATGDDYVAFLKKNRGAITDVCRFHLKVVHYYRLAGAYKKIEIPLDDLAVQYSTEISREMSEDKRKHLEETRKLVVAELELLLEELRQKDQAAYDRLGNVIKKVISS